MSVYELGAFVMTPESGAAYESRPRRRQCREVSIRRNYFCVRQTCKI